MDCTKRFFCAAILVMMLFFCLPRVAAGENISRDITVEDIGLTYHYYAQNDARWERVVYRMDDKGHAMNSLGNGGCQYVSYVTAFAMMGFDAHYRDDAAFVTGFLDRAMLSDKTDIFSIETILKKLVYDTGLDIQYKYVHLGADVDVTLDTLKALKVGQYAVPFLSDVYNKDGRLSHGLGSAVTTTGHYLTIIGHTLDAAGEVAYLYLSDPMYRPTYESYNESYIKGQSRQEKIKNKSYEKNHGYTMEDAFEIVQPGVLRITGEQLNEYFNYNRARLLVWGENLSAELPALAQ